MNRILTLITSCAVSVVVAGCSGGSGSTNGGTSGSNSNQTSTDPAMAGDLRDVQRALNDALPGDTVRIPAGSFDGRLVIVKSVNLVGSGDATVLRGIAGVDEPVLDVRQTRDVSIRQLTVSGPHEGLRVRESTRVRIEDVFAQANGDEGIVVRTSSAVTIVDCEATANTSGGVRVRDGSVDVLVEGCSIANNGDHGVEVRDSTDVTVRACAIEGSIEDGVRLRDSSDVILLDNTLRDNREYGVRIRSTPVDESVLRSDNLFERNGQGDVRVES